MKNSFDVEPFPGEEYTEAYAESVQWLRSHPNALEAYAEFDEPGFGGLPEELSNGLTFEEIAHLQTMWVKNRALKEEPMVCSKRCPL